MYIQFFLRCNITVDIAMAASLKQFAVHYLTNAAKNYIAILFFYVLDNVSFVRKEKNKII